MKRLANWLRSIDERLDPLDEPCRSEFPLPIAPTTGNCTARRCTLQPFHSPCAYQTALAARREAKRKTAIKPARKTGKAKR